MSVAIDTTIAACIDHTVLQVGATAAHIARACNEAISYNFAAVCVPPYYVEQAVKQLRNSSIKVATVVGFPFGYDTTLDKLFAISSAADDGVDEVDIVVNIGEVKAQNWEAINVELLQIVQLCIQENVVSKIIIETALLNTHEITKLCDLCARHKVNYVKTSTGFNGGGATVTHVQLLRKLLPPSIQIKASGGIRTRAQAQALLTAGANRLGCSRSLQIVSI